MAVKAPQEANNDVLGPNGHTSLDLAMEGVSLDVLYEASEGRRMGQVVDEADGGVA
jgi:hypothetical protein